MARTRAAVLGSPISHSRSPRLHRACYERLGIAAEYSAIEVTEETFPKFWADLDQSWLGLSLTMPLKRVVLPYLAALDVYAQQTGVVNTVVFTDNGPLGFNTDVVGFLETFQAMGIAFDPELTPTILGSGATAFSAICALAHRGSRHITVIARNETAIAAMRHRFPNIEVAWQSFELASPHGLVINTLPAQVMPRLEPQQGQFLIDVNYDPAPPPVLANWLRLGGNGCDGLELLLHQGVAQALLFTGKIVDAEQLATLTAHARSAISSTA